MDIVIMQKGKRMSNTDKNLEDLINVMFSLCDYARLGYRISQLNNCNNCSFRDCEYRPNFGGYVRFNCPLWKAEEDVR